MAWFFSWWKRNEQRFGAWASIIGLLSLGALFEQLASTTREIIYATSLSLICIGGLLCGVVYAVRLNRKAKYAEILPQLRAAVWDAIEETQHVTGHTVGEKKAALARIMDEVSVAFSTLTGSSCRTCVKVVERTPKKGGTLEVTTFCRNSKDRDAGGSHPIEHNTDFNELYQNPSKEWFFGNDLPARSGRGEYHNTTKDWQTKYRATVVWPIRQPSRNPQGSPSLLGFLCVDSRRTKAFSEEFDYPVGAMVADVLYPYLLNLVRAVESPGGTSVQAVRVSVGDDGEVTQVSEQGAANKNDD